ncbi:ribonuclease H protein [Pyrus ussuriensis x Pyrus communis]|uniref:Ribonuclease H protein n=1 Tax=Pyrus ussuriensis x Pyrus communis TaxID=2448454 RepID=A0A5N5H950_9ROSA|nr:ribonuclease H protein [Pyrus ussuriensis x Pyrus communis]
MNERTTINAIEGTNKLEFAGRKVTWKIPQFGTLKVNCDAAWNPQSHKGGVGWVIRNFAGLLHSAGGWENLHRSVEIVEATALRAALQECAKKDIHSIEIETDAKTIMQMINKETGTEASLEDIIHDIWKLAQTFQNATLTYAHRECNHAARAVASYVSKDGSVHLWYCIGPHFIFNIIAKM